MNPGILYLTRNYPNNIFNTNGLWVEGLVRAMSELCNVGVIAPVPYFPPLIPPESYARYRKILIRQNVGGVEVYRPRFLAPPGYWLHSYIGKLMYWSIVNKMDRYREKFHFDLIHAQFSYPEGYVGARLAKRYNVPLVITEHASWDPWMQQYPLVRKQAVWAAAVSSAVIAGSKFLGNTISPYLDNPDKLISVPIGVDTSLFKPAVDNHERDKTRLIYVGRIHPTKGVDVLFKAMKIMLEKGVDVSLTLVGGDLGFRDFRKQEDKMRKLAGELGILERLDFVGSQPPEKVVEYIQNSGILVLPSRRESFGAVLIEALACGIPVVATRCGGPEDFINQEVGVLVEKENPEELASGIVNILQRLDDYPKEKLHRYADTGYSWNRIADKIFSLYESII